MPQTLELNLPGAFNPEPAEDLRGRLQHALAEEHKPLDPVEPKHVFDFFDGLRLVVTLQTAVCPCCGKERQHVCVSACAAPGTLVGDRLRDGRGLSEFVGHAMGRLCEICVGLEEALSTEDGARYRQPKFVTGEMVYWMFPCVGGGHHG